MRRNIKYDKSIRFICGVLFLAFSVIYIYVFQGELLALMQDHLSKGVTKSNTLLAAIVISVLLALLQWFVNRYSKLHGRWEALSYIPSCLLLALVTDVNDGTLLYSASKWLWCVPICVVLYLGIIWLKRLVIENYKLGFFATLWPNLFTFTILFALTAQISNNAPAPHMELAAWNYLHDGKYEKMLEVGRRSDDYNAELVALRNLAMAKTGTLGERLFCYPQPYGADGLLFNKYNKQSVAYGAQEFYLHIGTTPYGGESGRAFAHRLHAKNDSVFSQDFYLAALLLDKDVETFVDELKESDSQETLPTHFQEALLLYNDKHPDSPVTFVADSIVTARYGAYRTLQSEHPHNAIVAENLCRRKFGNTYWCYYDY